MSADAPTVAVTGANGLVGAAVCAALAERGIHVRAAVRRPGTAPELAGVDEVVGDFAEEGFARDLVAGTEAVVATVHPMASDRDAQHHVAVEATPALARAAAEAGAARFVHISTTAVYDRSPEVGDVDEDSALVADDAGDYPVTKRDGDRALAEVSGITRVLVRPPAILGPGATSVWNTLRPDAMRGEEDARTAVPDASFPWVHVTDLAAFVAEVAGGSITHADDPARGPRGGDCVAVNVAGAGGTQRDYVATVTGALGVEPVWEDAPAWKGRILTGRAQGWGFAPQVGLSQALAEIAGSLRPVT